MGMTGHRWQELMQNDICRNSNQLSWLSGVPGTVRTLSVASNLCVHVSFTNTGCCANSPTFLSHALTALRGSLHLATYSTSRTWTLAEIKSTHSVVSSRVLIMFD